MACVNSPSNIKANLPHQWHTRQKLNRIYCFADRIYCFADNILHYIMEKKEVNLRGNASSILRLKKDEYY